MPRGDVNLPASTVPPTGILGGFTGISEVSATRPSTLISYKGSIPAAFDKIAEDPSEPPKPTKPPMKTEPAPIIPFSGIGGVEPPMTDGDRYYGKKRKPVQAPYLPQLPSSPVTRGGLTADPSRVVRYGYDKPVEHPTPIYYPHLQNRLSYDHSPNNRNMYSNLLFRKFNAPIVDLPQVSGEPRAVEASKEVSDTLLGGINTPELRRAPSRAKALASQPLMSLNRQIYGDKANLGGARPLLGDKLKEYPMDPELSAQMFRETMQARPVSADVVAPLTLGRYDNDAKDWHSPDSDFRGSVVPYDDEARPIPLSSSSQQDKRYADDGEEGKSVPVVSIGLGGPREGSKAPSYFNAPETTGMTGIHEWEHAHQPDPVGTLDIDLGGRRAAHAPNEIPAALSEMTHRMEAFRRQYPEAYARTSPGFGGLPEVTPGENSDLLGMLEGEQSTPASVGPSPDDKSINLPLVGEGLSGEYSPSIHWMLDQAKRYGHVGGGKTMTELLATPEGKQWLQMLLQRSTSREKDGTDKQAFPRFPAPEDEDELARTGVGVLPWAAAGIGAGALGTAYGMGSDKQFGEAVSGMQSMRNAGGSPNAQAGSPPPGTTRLQHYSKSMSPAASLSPFGVPVSKLIPMARRQGWFAGKTPLAPESGKGEGGFFQGAANALGEDSSITQFLRKGIGQPDAHITNPAAQRAGEAHYEAFANGPVPGYAHMLRGYEGGRTVDPSLTGGQQRTHAEHFGPKFDKFIADYTRNQTENGSSMLPTELNQDYMNREDQGGLLDEWLGSLNPAERAEIESLETDKMTNLGHENYRGAVEGASSFRDKLKTIGMTAGGAGLGGLAGRGVYRALRDDEEESWLGDLLSSGAGMGIGGLAGHYFANR
jgi:hypothetical protein